jgi:hypothetical protein
LQRMAKDNRDENKKIRKYLIERLSAVGRVDGGDRDAP